MSATSRSGAQILVDQLLIHGVDTIFCVPGESYIAVLDALYDQQERIRLVSARQEGGAAFMAEAYGKLTGRPGVCFVTRGPGASNASIGIHTAFHDSTPLMLFIGQVARGFSEREAFQEIDYRRMFSPIAKWVTQIDDPARVPELLARAFQLAVSGRPGPVVIALPEDMQDEQVAVADAAPYQRVQAHPGAAQIAAMRGLLAAAERPLLIVGGGDWSAGAADDMRAFAQANRLPAVASFRAQDIIDNRAGRVCGRAGRGREPGAERADRAGRPAAGGRRPAERAGHRRLPAAQCAAPAPAADPYLPRAIRAWARLPGRSADPGRHGRVRRRRARHAAGRWRALGSLGRCGARRLHALSAASAEPAARCDLGAVFAYLRERLPHDAIITNGAGNYTAWCHRFLQFSAYRSQVAPVNGTMGYGVPAAVAAKLIHPERTVVAFAGDGCFLMNGQELATAMRHELNIIVIVINNAMYGTIRMHQERRFPSRAIGTGLVNPDFARYAEAFGAYGEVVTRTAEFAPAFERAAAAGRPALLELRTE